jgi:hypothetical protein
MMFENYSIIICGSLIKAIIHSRCCRWNIGGTSGMMFIPVLGTDLTELTERILCKYLHKMLSSLPAAPATRYDTVESEAGCCKCNNLTTCGMVSMILLILFFWPLAFIPCCMQE